MVHQSQTSSFSYTKSLVNLLISLHQNGSFNFLSLWQFNIPNVTKQWFVQKPVVYPNKPTGAQRDQKNLFGDHNFDEFMLFI